MDTFTEYTINRDFWELTKINEGWWDALKTGVGTTGKQMLKGAGNTALGLGQMGLGATMGASSPMFGKGALRTGKGLLQAGTAKIINTKKERWEVHQLP